MGTKTNRKRNIVRDFEGDPFSLYAFTFGVPELSNLSF
jgi:hypothetical protein